MYDKYSIDYLLMDLAMPIILNPFNIEALNLRFEKLKHIIAIYFDFLGPLILLALYLIYDNYQHQGRMQLIHQPKVNDFYFIDYHAINKNSDIKYRFYPIKIEKINDEKIEFKLGNIGYTEEVAISEHFKTDAPMRRDFYRQKGLTVTHKQLADWLEQGIIYDIARPRNIYVNGWIVMHLHELHKDEKAN